MASACASPVGRDVDDDASPSTTSLGVPAVVAPDVVDGREPATSTTAADGDNGSDHISSTTAPGGAQSPDVTTTTVPRNYAVRARQADATGDHGEGAPARADAVAVIIESTDDYLRVTMELAGQPASALAENEVAGVGVDFFENALALESDYQLFADGRDEGWTAYLETPEGRVRYSGTLTLDRNRLVWELPWSALGGKRNLFVSGFSDWSDGTGAFGEDFIPDAGKFALQP